jgi:beta-N-acetylhexosaminidase
MKGFIIFLSFLLLLPATNSADTTDIEKKIGQMLMVWFEGAHITPEVERMIRDYKVGGVVLFKWAGNLESREQIAQLTGELQSLSMRETGAPLFISTDQEGGIVTRIPGATDFPGNMALGATGSTEYAYDVGSMIGKELSALGINMDLAPVLDVNVNPANPVIGLRSFGEDADLVSKLGIAYMQGLQDSGVIPVGKHFPGHGDTATDSHTGLPVVSYSKGVLKEVHLKPFSDAILRGIPSIMTAHIIVQSIDKERPATLSKAVLTDLLRNELGFNGVIMTDAMDMAAISEYYGPIESASVEAVKAGADIVLMPQTKDWLGSIERTIKEINDAVARGEISEERIDESYERIMNLKKQIYTGRANPSLVGCIEHREKELEIARSAITIVKDEEKLIPLKPSRKLLVVVPTPTFSAAEDPSMDAGNPGYYIREHYKNTKVLEITNNPGFEDIRRAISEAASSEMVIVFFQNGNINGGQLALAKKMIESKKPVIVVSMGVPYDLAGLPEAIAMYGKKECNMRALADVLFGKTEPMGTLPVTIG